MTTPTEYERHPASAAWGDMSEVEYDQLVEGMKLGGYDKEEPVIVLEGTNQIIDGWHRWQAAADAGLEAYVVEADMSLEEIALYVIAKHAGRRNLLLHDRIKCMKATYEACGMTEAPSDKPGKKKPVKKATGDNVSPVAKDTGNGTYTRDDIAKATGASKRTVQRALAKPPTAADVKKQARAKGKEYSSAQKAKAADREAIDALKEANEILSAELSDAQAEVAAANAPEGDVADAVAEYKRAGKEKDRIISRQAREIARLKKQLSGVTQERDEYKRYAAEMEKALAKRG